MTTPDTVQSKDDILKAFKSLLKTVEGQGSLITTKAEQAEREKDLEVAERAAGYTVQTIVTELADKQLNFSSSLDDLSGRLASESERLLELRRAIEVETKRIKSLEDIKVAAEALEIQRKENEERLQNFKESAEADLSELEEDKESARAAWAKEQDAHEASVAEYAAHQERERQQREEEFAYDRERQRKIELDEYDEKKRQLERELTETGEVKDKDWSEREAELAKHAEEIEELRAKVENFPEELKEKVDAEREKAISSTSRDAKVELSLLQKEIDASVEVSNLKIASLEATIEKQAAEIASLEKSLEDAQRMADKLAREAISRGRVASMGDEG
ncbi:MAG: hypothetical protein AAFS10_02305 [Myxococcota bacterium]